MLLLISGASGAGKTSVRRAIAGVLAPAVEAVELRHLDAAPTVRDMAWRQRMAERAVVRARALDEQGRHLLFAGDPVAPGEVLAAPSAPSVDIAVCLLDVSEDAQQERLRARGDPEELLPRHAAYADWLRRHASDPAHMPHVLATDGWDGMHWSRLTTLPWQITVIDVSAMSRDEACQAALQWVRDALSGRAPVFRR